MMNCHQCGKENEEGAAICKHCSATLGNTERPWGITVMVVVFFFSGVINLLRLVVKPEEFYDIALTDLLRIFDLFFFGTLYEPINFLLILSGKFLKISYSDIYTQISKYEENTVNVVFLFSVLSFYLGFTLLKRWKSSRIIAIIFIGYGIVVDIITKYYFFKFGDIEDKVFLVISILIQITSFFIYCLILYYFIQKKSYFLKQ